MDDGTVVANRSKSQQLCVTNLGFDEKARVFDDRLLDDLFSGLLDTDNRNQSLVHDAADILVKLCEETMEQDHGIADVDCLDPEGTEKSAWLKQNATWLRAVMVCSKDSSLQREEGDMFVAALISVCVCVCVCVSVGA